MHVSVKAIDAEPEAPLYFSTGNGLGISTDGGAHGDLAGRRRRPLRPAGAVFVP